MKPTHRFASSDDAEFLAAWNHSPLRDEGHRNPMTIAQLAVRMKDWLQGEYQAVIFSDPHPFGYALFRTSPAEIYLRQFYVVPEKRRQDLGRSAFSILQGEIWSKNVRFAVEVLSRNQAGIAFWKSVGCSGYCLTPEILRGPL